MAETERSQIAEFLSLAEVFRRQGAWKPAAECLEWAARIGPDDARVWMASGEIAARMGCLQRAEACLLRALRLDCGLVRAHYEMAHVLSRAGRFGEAIRHYRIVAAVHPDLAELIHNIGVMHQNSGRLEEAWRDFAHALVLDGNFAPAHYAVSLLHLLRGDYAEGWKGYEWRWGLMTAKPPVASLPFWEGEDPRGQNLLVFTDQGFGDAIQFVRLVSVLRARGATVTVGCPAPLRRLFSSVDGGVNVVTNAAAATDCTRQVALGSVPRLLGLDAGTIPASIPYLHPVSQDRERWRRLLGERRGLRVGLVWRGTADHANASSRNIALDRLAGVLETNGLTLVGLQKDIRPEERSFIGCFGNTVALSEELGDFAETAAVIANLDLVISVDTAVAHLSGAVGCPTWVLLPFIPDWRWRLDREDSPWYPTVRLFRQSSSRAWTPVIDRVAAELLRLVTAQASPSVCSRSKSHLL